MFSSVADPGDEPAGEAADHGQRADDPEAESDPGQPAPAQADDVGPVHDEDVVGVREPDRGDERERRRRRSAMPLPMKSLVTVALDIEGSLSDR